MKITAIALSFLLLARIATAQDTAELRHKWPSGLRFVYRMERTHTSELRQQGVSNISKEERSLAVDLAFGPLKEREGGGREMDLEILWERMEWKMDGKSLSAFDSSSPNSDNPMFAAFEVILGKKIKILAKSDGSVESITGLEALDSASPNAGGGLPPRRVNDATLSETSEDLMASTPLSMKDMLKDLLGGENLGDIIQFGNLIPEKRVKIGDAWDGQIDLPMGPMRTLGLKSKTTFTRLEKHGGVNCARLETALIVPAGTEIPSRAPDIKTSVESGRVTRTTWFDLDRGQILDSTMRQEFTLKINKPDSRSPERLIITIPVVQDITFKLTEIR